MTKRNGLPNKNHIARDAADKRRRKIMELRNFGGLTFVAIAKILGCTASRARQLYYGAQWRSDRWLQEENKSRKWQKIASEMVTELDLREAFYRELNHDRAIRNAAMPKQQPKPYDVIGC